MTKIALMLLAGATVSTAALADNTAMTRDEVRGMVSEMLSDAETRSSLLQGGGMVGYDKGFMVGSADGNWKLKFNGLIQFRYIANFRDEADTIPGGGDDLTNGFQMRKARVILSGNAVNPNLTYKIAFENNNSLGADAWGVRDLMFAYNMGDGWKVRGGEYKVGFLREELNSEMYTMAAERGVMNNFFTQGRSDAFGFTYENDQWKWSFDFSDGFNTAGTDFTAATESEFAGTVRGEYKWTGSWDALMDYTSKPGDANAGSVGFAGHWQTGTQPAAPTDAAAMWAATADVQWEGNGWGIFGAFVYTNIEQAGAGADDINHLGGCAQVSYRWNETSEVFARWDGIFLDDDDAAITTTLDDNIHFVTFGYNHYFAGHNAKLTIDCIWALNDMTNLIAAVSTNAGQAGWAGNGGTTSNGLIGSSDGGEFAIRAQFQLAF
jgi:hypothetical protein